MFKSEDQIVEIIIVDWVGYLYWQVIAVLLKIVGKKNYFLGDLPSEVDCAIFGMLASMYWHMPTSRHEVYMKGWCVGLQPRFEYKNRLT